MKYRHDGRIEEKIRHLGVILGDSRSRSAVESDEGRSPEDLIHVDQVAEVIKGQVDDVVIELNEN